MNIYVTDNIYFESFNIFLIAIFEFLNIYIYIYIYNIYIIYIYIIVFMIYTLPFIIFCHIRCSRPAFVAVPDFYNIFYFCIILPK